MVRREGHDSDGVYTPSGASLDNVYLVIGRKGPASDPLRRYENERLRSIVPHTLREVANYAGVSIATAVSAATRAKVSEAISRFGYSPNVYAALLAKTKYGVPKGRYRSGLELNFEGGGAAGAPSRPNARLKDDLFARVQELENENLRLRRLLVMIDQDTTHSVC